MSNIKYDVKYPSIFSRQMEAIVFVILQIFFVTRYARFLRCFENGGISRGGEVLPYIGYIGMCGPKG